MISHIEITNKKGKVLRGYLDSPQGAEQIIVMFHGYTGNKTEHNGHFRTFSRKISKLNIGSLRMDYSCNGESDGEFSEFLFTDALEDSKLMIDYAFSLQGIKKVSLLGFSMGGLIASLLSNYKPVDKIILWSPAGNLYEKLQKQFNCLPKIENGNGYLLGFEISKNLVESMKGFNPFDEALKFTNKVLVIHGREDKAVNYLIGKKYAETFPNGKIHIIDGAGHGYDRYPEVLELFDSSTIFLK